MMSRFEKVKKYFDDGLWNIQRVANAVIKGWIEIDEFQKITGENYDI